MDKILISACLVGENTKYDGGNNLNQDLEGLLQFYDLIPFCPEVEGGLKTPREPSEIIFDSVKSKSGKDVSKNFALGAEKALSIVRFFGIKTAILKEGSPSCGSHEIGDGTFSHKKIKGQGITARLLRENGVKVLNETEALELLSKLKEGQAKKEEATKKAIEADANKENGLEEIKEPKTFEKKEDRPRRYEKKPQFKPENRRFHKDGEDKPRGEKRFHESRRSRPFREDRKDKPFHKEKGERRFESRGKPRTTNRGKGPRKPGPRKIFNKK